METLAILSADAMKTEKAEEILAGLSEAKRQKIAATLGSIRLIGRADLESALRHDREWSAGLSPWRRWVARRIITVAEFVLRRSAPK
jgi:hypothetical protein